MGLNSYPIHLCKIMAKWKIWAWKQHGRDETVEELEEIVKEAKDRHNMFVIFFSIAVIVVCLLLRIVAVTSESVLSNGLRYFFAGLPFVFLFVQRGIVKQRLEQFSGIQAKDLVGAVAGVQGFISAALILKAWPIIAHSDWSTLSEEIVDWFYIIN